MQRHIHYPELVRELLIEHGRDRAAEPFLFEGQLYRITVERIPAEQAEATLDHFMQEMLHDHQPD